MAASQAGPAEADSVTQGHPARSRHTLRPAHSSCCWRFLDPVTCWHPPLGCRPHMVLSAVLKEAHVCICCAAARRQALCQALALGGSLRACVGMCDSQRRARCQRCRGCSVRHSLPCQCTLAVRAQHCLTDSSQPPAQQAGSALVWNPPSAPEPCILGRLEHASVAGDMCCLTAVGGTQVAQLAARQAPKHAMKSPCVSRRVTDASRSMELRFWPAS